VEATKPTYEQVLDNCRSFTKKVGVGDYYIWASKVVAEAWGKGEQDNIDIRGIVSGIMILEYSWNDVFYKDGLFDQKELEECINGHLALISGLRDRESNSINKAESKRMICQLFGDCLRALRKRNSGVRGPVAVAKCLHLLSPRFFPLWDTSIASATGHHWGSPVDTLVAAECYLCFMQYTQDLITHVIADFAEKRGVSLEGAVDAFLQEYQAIVGSEIRWKTILKLIDEYLYIEYTRPEWKGG
jgi:hypothetical protein